MKVGLITIVDYSNYGNRLQNYALQTFLEEKGIESETILHDDYYDYKHTKYYWRKLPISILKRLFWKCYSLFKTDKHELVYIWLSDSLGKQRMKKNIVFSEQNIKETDFIIREGYSWKRSVPQYDFFITGSDQVWNPNLPAKATDYYFLQFAEKGKRVAFSASVACDEIPEDKLKQWSYYASGMDYISVREEKACELVKKYTKRDAVRLLDPTMLIDIDNYYSLMKNHNTCLPQKYIVIYTLGNFDEKEKSKLENYAAEKGCEIVYLNTKEFPEYYTYDVIDFLNCIFHAEIVVTDSFHACVFSILFNKPFGVFKRKGEYEHMYSRIDNLMKIFGMETNEIHSIDEIGKIRVANKFRIDEILQREKNKAQTYIQTIIKNYEQC